MGMMRYMFDSTGARFLVSFGRRNAGISRTGPANVVAVGA